ncbi:hypothetical protein V8C86DRAFT_2738721, partial [Haematococcus lacustris]
MLQRGLEAARKLHCVLGLAQGWWWGCLAEEGPSAGDGGLAGRRAVWPATTAVLPRLGLPAGLLKYCLLRYCLLDWLSARHAAEPSGSVPPQGVGLSGGLLLSCGQWGVCAADRARLAAA